MDHPTDPISAQTALSTSDELSALRHVTETAPTQAVHWANKALDYVQNKCFAQAQQSIEQALALNNDQDEWHALLGHCLAAQGLFNDSLTHLSHAIRLNPRSERHFCELAQVLITLDQHADAKQCAELALSVNPTSARAYDLLGVMELNQSHWRMAAEHFVRALTHNPRSGESLNNLGLALREQAEFTDAVSCFKDALRIAPDSTDAGFNLATTLLLMGNDADGWPLYLKYKRLHELKDRPQLGPLWDGSASLSGKTIYVYREQGLGDTLQFARYLSLLHDMGARVLFAPHPALAALLNSQPNDYHLVEFTDLSVRADYHVPLLSLPALLANHPLPRPVFLSAQTERIRRWRDYLQKSWPNKNFTIGIHWQGSIGRVDLGRSIPVKNFIELSKVPGVRLLSLQKGNGVSQLADLADPTVIDILPTDWDIGANAFLDTAAIVSQLDLIITSDTALAHLAGTLGAKVWVALKYVPDWRWQLGREDTPWYPNMRLFRQARDGDWHDVFGKIRTALSTLLNENTTQ